MKLKVRAQLGEQAKAINLVNVGLQKDSSAPIYLPSSRFPTY